MPGVVADSSTLIGLAAIGRLSLHTRLGGRVGGSMEIEGRVPAGKPDLEAANLGVYPARPEEIPGGDEGWDAWWTPGLGLVRTPPGWVFLPRGKRFVTRKVKEWGRYWVVLRRRPGYTETLGLLAPEEAAAEALRLAEEVRGRRRAASARARERAEERYRRQLEQAMLAYLDFAPEHSVLAEEIARGAASRAAVVGSGRVGRTRKLALEEKAALAARAYIRHRYTRYEEMLAQPFAEGFYRGIKAAAQEEVDEFLERHRRTGGAPGPGGPGGVEA